MPALSDVSNGCTALQVAESLGITDEFLSKQEVRMDRPARQRTSQETDGKQPEGASSQKRGGEVCMGSGGPVPHGVEVWACQVFLICVYGTFSSQATEDLQASVKRTRTAAPPEDTAEAPATHGPGCKQPPPLGAPGAREGKVQWAGRRAGAGDGVTVVPMLCLLLPRGP